MKKHSGTEKKKLISFTAILLFFSSVLLTGCTYNSEEALYPPCDTTVQVSFSGQLLPIIQANCNVCHSQSQQQGNIITETYSDDSLIASNGRLYGAISHAAGYSQMPQGAAKLSDCDISKFRKWIDSGYPNN